MKGGDTELTDVVGRFCAWESSEGAEGPKCRRDKKLNDEMLLGRASDFDWYLDPGRRVENQRRERAPLDSDIHGGRVATWVNVAIRERENESLPKPGKPLCGPALGPPELKCSSMRALANLRLMKADRSSCP